MMHSENMDIYKVLGKFVKIVRGPICLESFIIHIPWYKKTFLTKSIAYSMCEIGNATHTEVVFKWFSFGRVQTILRQAQTGG